MYVYMHLWTHKTSNLKVDGLQKPKSVSVSAPVTEEQESEATENTSSPKLDL